MRTSRRSGWVGTCGTRLKFLFAYLPILPSRFLKM